MLSSLQYYERSDSVFGEINKSWDFTFRISSNYVEYLVREEGPCHPMRERTSTRYRRIISRWDSNTAKATKRTK